MIDNAVPAVRGNAVSCYGICKSRLSQLEEKVQDLVWARPHLYWTAPAIAFVFLGISTSLCVVVGMCVCLNSPKEKLLKAAKEGDLKTVQNLLGRWDAIKTAGFVSGDGGIVSISECFVEASRGKHEEVMRALLRKFCTLKPIFLETHWIETTFSDAASGGEVETIRALLEESPVFKEKKFPNWFFDVLPRADLKGVETTFEVLERQKKKIALDPLRQMKSRAESRMNPEVASYLEGKIEEMSRPSLL